MPRKKYIRRRIVKQESLQEEIPIDFHERIDEILAENLGRYKYVRVGFTMDLKAEYDTRVEYDDIAWSSMMLCFAPQRFMTVSAIYQHLLKNHPENLISKNEIQSPLTLFALNDEYYVYVMLGKRKKNTQKIKSEYNQRFGRRLLALRTSRQFSQRDLAMKCNTTRGTIGKIERGEKSATVNLIYRFAIVFGISAKDFFD